MHFLLPHPGALRRVIPPAAGGLLEPEHRPIRAVRICAHEFVPAARA
jgi:hypothetical protein